MRCNIWSTVAIVLPTELWWVWGPGLGRTKLQILCTHDLVLSPAPWDGGGADPLRTLTAAQSVSAIASAFAVHERPQHKWSIILCMSCLKQSVARTATARSMLQLELTSEHAKGITPLWAAACKADA